MQGQYTPRRNPELGSAERLIPAVVLIGLGALFLLHNLHIFAFREVLRYWPAILVAIGLVKLVDSNSHSARVGGGILLAIGGILLAQTLGFWYIRMADLWPLFLIGVGLFLLFQRAWEWPLISSAEMNSGSKVDVNALFGGGKRNVVARDFRGATASALFGGIELDLRQAEIAGESATIEANAMFGGVSVRIPAHWSAVLQGTGIFGGFSDESVQPSPGNFPVIKRLVVKGGALFGGVVVKN